jgi:hypothetical protein
VKKNRWLTTHGCVRKKPGRNGVVWSGQALEKYKQRKREEMLEFLRKARALEAEK